MAAAESIMASSLSTASPTLSPKSNRSIDSSQSGRRLGWRKKLSQFRPKAWRSKKQVPVLELQNTVEDDVLMAIKQVVRTILENKEQEITKGAMYSVLRKFAQCQVDIQKLRQQLRKASLELERSRKIVPDAMDRTAPHATVPELETIFYKNTSRISEADYKGEPSNTETQLGHSQTAEISKLQQMILDLDLLHAQQCCKYQEALNIINEIQNTDKATKTASDMQFNQLQAELEQQRSATRLCEQVIEALRETLSEQGDTIQQQKVELETLHRLKTQELQDSDLKLVPLKKQLDRVQQTQKVATLQARNLDEHEQARTGSTAQVHDKTTACCQTLKITPDSVNESQPNADASFVIDKFGSMRVLASKHAGFMITRFTEARHKEVEGDIGKEYLDSMDEGLGSHNDRVSQKPWRVDELRNRRNSREEEMKKQFSRFSQTSSAMI